MTRSPGRLAALAMIVAVIAAPSARAAEPPPIESTRIEAPKIEPQQIAIDSVATVSIAQVSVSIDSVIQIAQAPPLAVAALDSVAPAIESDAQRHPGSLALHLSTHPTARSSLNRSSPIAAAALTRRHPALT